MYEQVLRTMDTVHKTEVETLESLSDSELVRRIHSGDFPAESELVARYSRGVFYLLRRRANDIELAEDLHQETFRIVLLRLRTQGLAEPAKAGRFILRTARNLLLGDTRKTSRRATYNDPASVESALDQTPSLYSQLASEQTATLVRKLIAQLNRERDRVLLYRFYVNGESKEMICEELGIGNAHFHRVLFRARQRLKDLILREFGDTDQI